MIVIKCDRCGETIKEVKDSDKEQDMKWERNVLQLDFVFNGQYIKADLCESCKQKTRGVADRISGKEKGSRKGKGNRKGKERKITA